MYKYEWIDQYMDRLIDAHNRLLNRYIPRHTDIKMETDRCMERLIGKWKDKEIETQIGR